MKIKLVVLALLTLTYLTLSGCGTKQPECYVYDYTYDDICEELNITAQDERIILDHKVCY